MSRIYNGKEITQTIYIKNGLKRVISAIYYIKDGAKRIVFQAVRSCFGSGKWIGKKPWIGTEKWKGTNK